MVCYGDQVYPLTLTCNDSENGLDVLVCATDYILNGLVLDAIDEQTLANYQDVFDNC